MKTHRLLKRVSSISVLLLGAALIMAPAANAMKLQKQNLQQLTQSSQSIINGQVIKVTDGFQNGAPYTEITIKVGSDAKGKHAKGSEYTFRQFGLIKPRSMGNGKVYLGVTPEGFAKWREGEHVIAFMYKKASRTGFQTTTGMMQGKFNIINGFANNALNNDGIFDEVNITDMTSAEQSMVITPGAADAAAFMSLIGKLAGVAK
ncbi:MAG: hypothetical protein V5788_09515 [Shewanella sp.]